MAPTINQVSSSSPFRLLGLTPDSTKAEIRRAYLALSLQYHPDKNDGKTHETFVAIKAAYDKCVRDADKTQNVQGRGTGPSVSTSQQSRSRSASSCSRTSSQSWPLHQRRTTPPEEFSSDINDHRGPKPLTHDDVLSLHNKYLDRPAELQKYAAAINQQLLAGKLGQEYPETFRAAEYVGRWLLAETQEHKDLFAFLQKKRWWQKRRAELARRQVVWYVGKMSVGEEVLKKIHHWLKTFMLRHVDQRHSITPEDESSFVRFARKYCPEDVKDRQSRLEKARRFREKSGR